MPAVYRTIQGDTWDMIAKKVYGSEKYMDYLMANNFPLLDEFVFSAGTEVRILELPESESSDLPAWRKRS